MKHPCLILILLFAVALYGCGEVHCPGFPEDLYQYMSYNTGDTVTITNGTDTVGLVIAEAYRQNSYSFKKNCDCSCEDVAGFETNYDPNSTAIIRLYAAILSQDTLFEFKFQHNHFSTHTCGFVTDYSDSCSSRTYDQVMILESGSASDSVYKAVFSKGTGFIRAYLRNPERVWFLVEK